MPKSTFNQVSCIKSHRIFSLFQSSNLEELPNELPSQPVSPVKHLQTLLKHNSSSKDNYDTVFTFQKRGLFSLALQDLSDNEPTYSTCTKPEVRGMAKSKTIPAQTCVRKNLKQELSCFPCLSAQKNAKVFVGKVFSLWQRLYIYIQDNLANVNSTYLWATTYEYKIYRSGR